MSIQLVDYEGSYLSYSGGMNDAIEFFCKNDEYWKLLVDWVPTLFRENGKIMGVICNVDILS